MRGIEEAVFTIWFQSLIESPLQFRPWYCDDDARIAHILTTRWCTLHRHERFIRQVVSDVASSFNESVPDSEPYVDEMARLMVMESTALADTESFIRQVALDFASSYNESVPDLAPYDDELARLRTMHSFDPTALAGTDSEDESIPDSIPDLISDPDDSDYDDGLFIHPRAFCFSQCAQAHPCGVDK